MNQASNQGGIDDLYAAMFANDTISSLSSIRAEDEPSSQTPSSPTARTLINQLTSSDVQHRAQHFAPLGRLCRTPGNTDERVNSDDEDDEDANLTSSGRRSRSHVWPPTSDLVPIIPRPIVFQAKTIGHTGRNAGRNLMAKFAGSDGQPRTRFDLRVLRGRSLSYLPDAKGYPTSDTLIPGGLTLTEICRSYPRHVWGTGLRLFIAEGWTGEEIFNAFPAEFRDSKAVQRPWNYIQQGFTREVRRINEEDAELAATLPVTRKRTADEAGLNERSFNAHPHLRMRPSSSWPTTSLQRNFPSHALVTPVTQYRSHLRRQAEISRQETLMLDIMAVRSRYRDRSWEERLNRARCARVLLLRMIGVELYLATEVELRGFTMFLEEELSAARRQHRGGVRDR